MRDAPGLERVGDLLEPRRGRIPIVERRLQRRHDVRGICRALEIARDDDQLPVAAVLERGKLHDIERPDLRVARRTLLWAGARSIARSRTMLWPSRTARFCTGVARHAV